MKKILIKTGEFAKETGKNIYKYRYWIALVVFVLCILFEISGSSIGCWKMFVNSNVTDDGVIIGKSRSIRSDEWAVLTPMSFSQKFDGFKYFSNLLRGTSTDVFMVYGLPTLNLMEIFRPFQIGFLILGIAKGLSFFWCGRCIALFLVSFEMGMIITKKNKLLSFLEAVLVTLAPMVQWWFAVNGVAEIFIFGQLAIILLNKYMNTDSLKKRTGYLAGMVICAGGYALVMYPAWQIPMAYVFGILAIWTIIENRKNCKINYKDIISIVIAILVLGCCMGYIILKSSDTIKAVMGTVYPGARTETGGKVARSYIQYVMNIFMPFKESGINTNICEEAVMFTLFPIGLIIAFISLIKEKSKDKCLILLLVVYGFLGIWCVYGFPQTLAKLTLLSNSPANRTKIAVGFLDILILIRGLAIIKEPVKKRIAIPVSLVLSAILVYWSKKINPNYFRIPMLICMGIMCVYLFYFVLRYKAKYTKIFLTCGLVFVMLMSGATVNPIRHGVGIIYDSEIIKKVQQIDKKEEGTWITEALGFPMINYILMAGVPSINTTNTYPDMEKWRKIDSEGQYEDVYNRYAHIIIKIIKSNEEKEEKFVLISPDSFEVYMTPDELLKLDVKYIFTCNNLEEYDDNNAKFELIDKYENYNMYKLKGM